MPRKPPFQNFLPIVVLALVSSIGVFAFFILKDGRGKQYDGTLPFHNRNQAHATTLSPSKTLPPSVRDEGASLPAKLAKEKWIVIMNVNIGFYEFFMNWWAYYKCLKLDHEVYIIAEDDELEKILLEAKLEHVKVERNPLTNSSKALVYGTEEYSKMMFARPSYVLRHLQLGHNIITTDIDTGIKLKQRKWGYRFISPVCMSDSADFPLCVCIHVHFCVYKSISVYVCAYT
jgi:hypothetical protein